MFGELISISNMAIAAGLAVAFGVGKLVYTFYIRSPKDVKQFGKWAMVTGATDGIGHAYCHELALRGMNIILVSRTQKKLQDCAQEIEKKFNVQTKIVVIDFSSNDSDAMKETLSQAVEGVDVGILVNNVGMSYDHPEYFCELPEHKVENLIKLNILSLTTVTSAILPGMVERKRGAVVNISSSSGFFPNGLLTVYSASKAFVDFFSRGLAQEYASTNIHIQSVLPLYVTTKLSKMRRPSFFVPTPQHYVKQALNTLGYESRTTGYFSHALQIALTNFLPSTLVEQYILKMHHTIRRIAHKKKKTAKKD